MAGHDWTLSWPGNVCKRCGADDPAETCMGTCSLAPSDENGYPNPFKCPVHGAEEMWTCPAGDSQN